MGCQDTGTMFGPDNPECGERRRGHCCCEHCNTWTLDCEDCCKCVPRRFCVKFIPDDTASCDYCGVRLTWSTGNIYSGSLTCNGTSLNITITLLEDYVGDATGTGTAGPVACYWRVEIPELEIDDYYPVREAGETGTGTVESNAVGCKNPAFSDYTVTLEGGTTGTDDDCAGTIKITRDDRWVMSLVKSNRCWEDYCGDGNCRCVSQYLCAEYVTSSGVYFTKQNEPLTFDEDTKCWTGSVYRSELEDDSISITVCLTKNEETGNCKLEATATDSGTGTYAGTGTSSGSTTSLAFCDDISVTIQMDDLAGAGTGGDSLFLNDYGCMCSVASCPERCVNTGDIHAECGAEEFAVWYFVSGVGSLTGSGSECCTPASTGLEKVSGECLWRADCVEGAGTGSPANRWELDGSTEKLTMTGDGNTELVYEATVSWDQLCTTEFILNESLSTLPEDCSYYVRVCVSPDNSCCDSEDIRETALPRTLDVAGQHCCDGSPPTDFTFTITWDASESRWKGSTTICSSTLAVEMYCVCGLAAGCGGTNECYEMDFTFGGCGVPEGATQQAAGACECDPFEVTFDLGSVFNNCCGAGDLIDLVLVVTE